MIPIFLGIWLEIIKSSYELWLQSLIIDMRHADMLVTIDIEIKDKTGLLNLLLNIE